MKNLIINNRKVGLTILVLGLAMAVLTIQMWRVFAANKSVSGSGESPGGIVLTVSAVEHENGNVTGQAMFHDRQTNSKLVIDVTEILVNGNVATVDGEVIKRTGTYTTDCGGTHAIFAVQDNGEGSDAQPVDGFTLETCYKPGQGVKTVKPFGSERGNLQVRNW